VTAHLYLPSLSDAYHSSPNGDLNVYTDIEFAGVGCDRKNGLVCTLKFAPINNSTNAKEEVEIGKTVKDYYLVLISLLYYYQIRILKSEQA
jgi:hypothetical protein